KSNVACAYAPAVKGLARLGDWIRGRPTMLVDAAIALGLFLLGSYTLIDSVDLIPVPPESAGPVGIFGVACCGLVLRRTRPILAFAVVESAAVIGSITGTSSDIMGLPRFLMLFTVADLCQPLTAWFVLAVDVVYDYIAVSHAVFNGINWIYTDLIWIGF